MSPSRRTATASPPPAKRGAGAQHAHPPPCPPPKNKQTTTKKQEIDELYKIFMTLGTPDESAWPGVTQLPEFQPDVFPQWRGRPLGEVCPSLDPQGLDLLSRMLTYDPQQRVTARMALQHSYFSDIPQILDDPPRL